MNGRDEPQIKSVEEMIGRFTSELLSLIKRSSISDPEQFKPLENARV